MTYSIDFREAVLAHIDSGASFGSTSILFSIDTTTIKNWKDLRASTGKLKGSGGRDLNLMYLYFTQQ